MITNISIPTTEEQWRQALGIDNKKRLISSSMWIERDILLEKEYGTYLKGNCINIYNEGDCSFVIANALETGSRIKVTFCVFWEPIGSNCESDSDKKRIAYFLSELPSESFLHELKHIDQLAMWVYKKNFAIRLAKCWEAGHSTPDNPLIKDLEQGLIDQWESDYICLQTSYYEQIWKLLQQRGRKIIKSLKKHWDCPFNSERELIQELLKEVFDNEYSLLLQRRYIRKNSDSRKLATLSRKAIREGSLTEEENKILLNLRKQLGGNTIWHDRLVDICHSLARKDAFVRSWLGIIKAHQDAECAAIQTSACNPQLREDGHGRSFACINGRIYPNLRNLPKSM